MKIRVLFILFSLSVTVNLSAQKMRDVFGSMPDSVLEVMTRNNRLDCIDFIENNMEAKVRNRFDGHSVLNKLTDDYLDLSLTQRTNVQMKLLPISDSLNMVAIVWTYSAPSSESVMRLFSDKWEELQLKDYLTAPAYDEYWVAGDSVSEDDVERLKSAQDMRFVRMNLDADSCRLVFELQTGEVEKEVAEEMGNLLRPIEYRWDGKRFVKAKAL